MDKTLQLGITRFQGSFSTRYSALLAAVSHRDPADGPRSTSIDAGKNRVRHDRRGGERIRAVIMRIELEPRMAGSITKSFRDRTRTSAAWVEADREGGWLSAVTLPCDIHVPLIESGIIKDPVLADYSYKCEWTEKKVLVVSEGPSSSMPMIFKSCERAELVLEGIDGLGYVFVNGRLLGRHESAHFPFIGETFKRLARGRVEIRSSFASPPEWRRLSEQWISILIRKNIAVEYEAGRGDRGDKSAGPSSVSLSMSSAGTGGLASSPAASTGKAHL